MNSPALLVGSIVAAAATAAAVTWYTNKPAVAAETGDAGAGLEARIAGVESKLGDLLQRLDRVGAEVASAGSRSAVQPVSAADIEAAVTKYLTAQGGAQVKPAGKTGGLTKDQALAQLAEIGGDYDKIDKLWPTIEKAGIEDEVLAHFKAMADAAPTDAQTQYQYGAYLIAGIENKPMAKQGELAMAADAAFDKTLKLDDKHWGARFMKATSLSFWPRITGKHVEALNHFEVLADQQEQVKPQPHFAETYLFLGNMHLGNGDQEKARAAFERGLRWFPDHEELKKQQAGLKK